MEIETLNMGQRCKLLMLSWKPIRTVDLVAILIVNTIEVSSMVQSLSQRYDHDVHDD